MQNQSLVECNLELLRSGRFSDVVFIVGQAKERILSHRFPLASRSPVFDALFQERWDTAVHRSEEIQVPDIEPGVFRQFLRYMYGNEFPTTIYEAAKILFVAHKYEMILLVEHCENLIRTTMEVMEWQDAVSIYEAAVLFNMPALATKAADLMTKEFALLISHPSFQLMREQTLLEFLPKYNLQVKEVQLFHALLSWSNQQLGTINSTPEDQRRVLERILPLVRFPAMKAQDFATKVIPKNILTSVEACAIFTYMNSEPFARPGLRANLGFPWQPRRLDCKIVFYEPIVYSPDRPEGNRMLYDCCQKERNQVDEIKLSIEETINENSFEPPALHKKTVSVASVILRGPNYSRVQNNTDSWNKTWRVSLKIEKLTELYGDDDDDDDGENVGDTQSRCVVIDNIELFGNKDTQVDIEEPFVLLQEFEYTMCVSYVNSVYLLHPRVVGDPASSDDFLTATRMKHEHEIKNSFDTSKLELDVLPVRDRAASCFKKTTHCIRGVNLHVSSQ